MLLKQDAVLVATSTLRTTHGAHGLCLFRIVHTTYTRTYSLTWRVCMYGSLRLYYQDYIRVVITLSVKLECERNGTVKMTLSAIYN